LAPGKNVYYYDDLCMGYLFQAVLLHESERDEEAEKIFQQLFSVESKIVLGIVHVYLFIFVYVHVCLLLMFMFVCLFRSMGCSFCTL